MSDIEGKAARVAAKECGQRMSFNSGSDEWRVTSDEQELLIVEKFRRCLTAARQARVDAHSFLQRDPPSNLRRGRQGVERTTESCADAFEFDATHSFDSAKALLRIQDFQPSESAFAVVISSYAFG